MSEYRQKIPGFVWPSHLDPEIRWLARDCCRTPGNGDWFGWRNKPYIEGGYWYASDSSDDQYGTDVSLLVLPEGREPILLCRDDYEQPASPSGTEARVCQDIADRQRRGREKYGMTVDQSPLSLHEWLTHAYEECLDQAVYLRRAIEELDDNAEVPK